MNTVFAIGTWFTPFFIERWGRKNLMFWTAVGRTSSMAVFIAMQGLAHKTVATEWTAVFQVGFGWMGCPWLYGPGMSPLRYRHIGGAANTIGEWSMTVATWDLPIVESANAKLAGDWLVAASWAAALRYALSATRSASGS